MKRAIATGSELEARILVLSRENTNVRSLALSLNKKRKGGAARRMGGGRIVHGST